LAANADHRYIMGARAHDRLPAAAQLDDPARQLDGQGPQLCEVGSVGGASAERLYALGSENKRIEKVSRASTGRIAARKPPPGSQTANGMAAQRGDAPRH
jgi:hypothetical protein